MNDILKPKLSKTLDDWTIRTIGIVDKTTFLVVADWDPKDNPKKKFTDIIPPDGKEYDFWTGKMSIDISNNSIRWNISFGGLGKCHLDGGYIQGHKQASIISYNGISYFIDWNADGDFGDAGEQVATNIAVNTGNTILTVNVPTTAPLGATYARF